MRLTSRSRSVRVTGDWYGLPSLACARVEVINDGPDDIEVRQDVGDGITVPALSRMVLQGVDNADRLEVRIVDPAGDQLVGFRFERVPMDAREGAESIRYVEVEAMGPMDDDLRVSIGGIVVADSRLHSSWYVGRKQVFSPVSGGTRNLDWASTGWRKIRISDGQARELGVELVPGLVVAVDLFDGWGDTYAASSWKLNVGWSDGAVFSTPVDVQGVSGVSVGQRPPAGTVTTTIGLIEGWTPVQYFPVGNDLSINGDGIGRTGSGNFGAGWAADTMAFYVSGVDLGADDFTLEYEWKDAGGGFGRNKHGMGWWANSSQHGAGLGEVGSGVGWIGVWDVAFSNWDLIVDGVKQPRVSHLAHTNATGVWVYRRISRVGETWTMTDGTSYGDDSLGKTVFTSSATVGPLVGITMAGTHRMRRLSWTGGAVDPEHANYYVTGPHFAEWYGLGSAVIQG